MRRCSLLLPLLIGCAGPGPKSVLNDYARALKNGDAARVHQFSDASTQSAYSEKDTQDRLQNSRAESQALGAALASAHIDIYADARLEDGRLVRLVKAPEGWRVAQGGLRFARYDTPESALETLVRATRSGRLSEVRGAMPEAYGARYSTDAKLRAHLLRVSPRIEAAWAALAPLSSGQATVDGDRAQLRYGTARSVRFVRESSRWRVLDVE